MDCFESVEQHFRSIPEARGLAWINAECCRRVSSMYSSSRDVFTAFIVVCIHAEVDKVGIHSSLCRTLGMMEDKTQLRKPENAASWSRELMSHASLMLATTTNHFI